MIKRRRVVTPPFIVLINMRKSRIRINYRNGVPTFLVLCCNEFIINNVKRLGKLVDCKNGLYIFMYLDGYWVIRVLEFNNYSHVNV